MRENILAFFSKTIQEKKMRILKALVVVSADLALLASHPLPLVPCQSPMHSCLVYLETDFSFFHRISRNPMRTYFC